MVWHLKPSTGDGELHTPPQQTPPSGGTPHHLQADLGDLADHEVWSSWKSYTKKSHNVELMCPPAAPPTKWACPSGIMQPKEDDQEVTFPGGEGGVH